MKTQILLALAFTFASAGLFAADKSPLNIPTVTAKMGQSAVNKEYSALTAFAEDRVCTVAPRFGGFVETIYADAKYKTVKKGEVLLEVSSIELYDLLNHMHHGSMYEDENDTNRSTKLSQKILNKLELLDIDESDIGFLGDKNASFRRFKIKSACSGVIIEKDVSKGSSFEMGQKLYTIVDNSTLWLEIKIYENDLSSIQVGQSVDVSFANGYEKMSAKIVKILPEVNAKDRTVTARAIIQNKNGKLAANMFVKAKVASKASKGIILPKTAVLERGGKMFVFVKNESGKFEPLEITARKAGDSYVVTEGVKEGDKVANGALFMLDSDAKLQGLY